MPGLYNNLEAKNFVAGGGVAISLDGIEPGTRVRSIQLTFDLSGTKANGDTLSGDLFAQIVANIKIGTYVNLNGLELFRLRHAINGRVVEDPTSVGAGAGTFTMFFTLDIPFRDPRQTGSDDGAIPSELLAARNIEITFAAANVWGVGSLTVTAGVVRASLERVHETNVPQINRISFVDQSSSTTRLEPGIYKDLFISKTDGSTLTKTDVAIVDIYADGVLVMQNMRFEQLISLWNRTAAMAAGSRAELVQTGALFLPLIWQDKSGKSNLTKQVAAEQYLMVQIVSGTLTTGRFSYWKAMIKDDSTVKAVAQLIGAPANSRVYEPATVKGPLQNHEPGEPASRKTRLIYGALAGKMRTRVTPGNVAG